jgi:hypothetical protein
MDYNPLKYVSINKTKQFHLKKNIISKIVLSTIDPNEIIYGEQALKVRFPKFLERPTQDYDVFSPMPLKNAREAEKKLDKFFGGDFFFVKPATHPNTFRVIAHANQEVYADFTKMPKTKIPYNKIEGHNYVTLGFEKTQRNKILQNPTYKWRHGKDKDALNRIIVFEKMKKKKT